MISRRLLVAGGCAAAAFPAAVLAQTSGLSVTLDPAKPKRGSMVDLVLDGAALGDAGGRPPTSVRVISQAGFRFDASAVAGRCRAGATSCPDDARIGSGRARAAYSFLGLGGTASVKAEAYLTEPTQPGDLAGVVLLADIPELGRRISIDGRVLRAPAPDGLELRVENLLSGAGIPPGVSVTLQRLEVRAGASRTVVRTKRVRRRGKRVKVRVRSTRSLVTTPKSCSGTWAARGIVGLANGGERLLPVAIPCRR